MTGGAFAEEQQAHSNTKAAVKTQKYYAEIYGYSYDEVAYIGDDLADIPILKSVGLTLTHPRSLIFI